MVEGRPVPRGIIGVDLDDQFTERRARDLGLPQLVGIRVVKGASAERFERSSTKATKASTYTAIAEYTATSAEAASVSVVTLSSYVRSVGGSPGAPSSARCFDATSNTAQLAVIEYSIDCRKCHFCGAIG